jgi:hypothetical protein
LGRLISPKKLKGILRVETGPPDIPPRRAQRMRLRGAFLFGWLLLSLGLYFFTRGPDGPKRNSASEHERLLEEFPPLDPRARDVPTKRGDEAASVAPRPAPEPRFAAPTKRADDAKVNEKVLAGGVGERSEMRWVAERPSQSPRAKDDEENVDWQSDEP